MEWTQFAIFIITIAGMFAYVRSENKEWRKEHNENMDKWRKEHKDSIDKWRKEHKEDTEKSRKEWNELFKLFLNLKIKRD